jgi:hypothetical protein
MADETTVDAQQLMREIQQQIWAQAGDEDVSWLPDLEPEMRAQLVRLRELATSLQVEPDVQAVSLPIVGRLVTWWRSQLHSLVLFYINDLARQQTALACATLRTLIHMAAENRQLRQEVTQLRQEMARLGSVGDKGE